MYHFCTYFDSGYLARGLALYYSLQEHCSSFHLWILCFDRFCYNRLKELKLQNVTLISEDEFLYLDKELLLIRDNRSRIEYYFTCTPSLPLFIINRNPVIDQITYLDADIFFLSNPKPIFDEISNNSIALTEHRFPKRLTALLRHGRYNVGWLSFRSDKNGLDCLYWWRERCIEWCYDRVEDGRFADQKYLDDWTERFQEVHVIRHLGANVAPWNINNNSVYIVNNSIYIDGQELIFYHVQGLRKISSQLYDPNLALYKNKISYEYIKYIYAPYIRMINRFMEDGRELHRPNLLSKNILSVYKGILLRRYIIIRNNKIGYLNLYYQFISVE